MYLSDEDSSEINEFTCYEAKIEESERGRQPLGVELSIPLG